MAKKYMAFGSVLMFLAVALGALGAHFVKHHFSARYATYETAVLYHVFHALALLVLGVLCHQALIVRQKLLFMLLITGIILFSGSLYAYTLTGVKFLVFVTPLGGLTLMGSWLLLSIDLLTSKQ